MLSNDLWSLHIPSKTRLSIPDLLGGGAIFKVYFAGGGENFDTSSEGKLHPPTHFPKIVLKFSEPEYFVSNDIVECCLQGSGFLFS